MMGRCNYCDMKRIKERAKRQGMVVSVRASSFMGGTDVWVHPPEYKLPPKSERIEPCDEYPNGNDAFSRYKVGWFMEIPKRCAC